MDCRGGCPGRGISRREGAFRWHNAIVGFGLMPLAPGSTSGVSIVKTTFVAALVLMGVSVAATAQTSTAPVPAQTTPYRAPQPLPPAPAALPAPVAPAPAPVFLPPPAERKHSLDSGAAASADRGNGAQLRSAARRQVADDSTVTPKKKHAKKHKKSAEGKKAGKKAHAHGHAGKKVRKSQAAGGAAPAVHREDGSQP